jgi:hypothetical protein
MPPGTPDGHLSGSAWTPHLNKSVQNYYKRMTP